MMRTGQIPERRAVNGGVLAMTMTIMTARMWRTHWAVRKEPGKEREQRMGRGKGRRLRTGWGKGRGRGRETVKGKVLLKTPRGDDISRGVTLQLQKEMSEEDLNTEG